ncbi:MAG: hypothetical protein WA208_02780 [Thermoanaerobaculia bacterium]
MARKSVAGTGNKSGENHEGNLIRRASSAIGKLFGRRPHTDPAGEPVRKSSSRTAAPAPESKARPTRRPSDIGLDVLDRTYTPASTSGKAGFRSDGADHQSDQEFALGVSDERWADEDRYTNKSGDPRIGTHNRTYEPGEAQADPRNR